MERKMIYKEWNLCFKKLDDLLSKLSMKDVVRNTFQTKTQSLKEMKDGTYSYNVIFKTDNSGGSTGSTSLTPKSLKQTIFGSPVPSIGQTIISGGPLTAHAPTSAYIINSEKISVDIIFDMLGIKSIIVSAHTNTLISSHSGADNREYLIYCTGSGFFINDDYFDYEDTDVMFNQDIIDDTKICLMELRDSILKTSNVIKKWGSL